jgi:hypothetical protein
VAANLCDYLAVFKALVGLPRVNQLEKTRSLWVKAFITIAFIEFIAWVFLQSPQHSSYLLTAATGFCLAAMLCAATPTTETLRVQRVCDAPRKTSLKMPDCS